MIWFLLSKALSNKGKEYLFEQHLQSNRTRTEQELNFHPEHAVYYIVVPFDPTPITYPKHPNLRQHLNTYRAKIRPLSDFIGLR